MFLPKLMMSITLLLLLEKSTPAGAEVEGCFSSFPNPGEIISMGGSNSNGQCQDTCKDKGYILAATIGDQCMCGDTYPKGLKVSDSECNKKCRVWPCGGVKTCCGGPTAYTVSVVGDIDVAKQVLRRISHRWRNIKTFREKWEDKLKKPSCDQHDDDWRDSFNRRGLSQCEYDRYMTGLKRNKRTKSDPISRIEEAKCRDAPSELISARGERDCYYDNWWSSFNSKGWVTCKDGYYLAGLNRTSGNGLHNIEEGFCCSPKSQKKHWGHCYDLDLWKKFDSDNWGLCGNGYYMVGLYRNKCDQLHCLEEFRCCEMGKYNGDSFFERPDFAIKVKDGNGNVKQCSMNAMDKSPNRKTYKCVSASDASNLLELNVLNFNIEEQIKPKLTKSLPIKNFRPVICPAHSVAYKCAKSLSAEVSSSSKIITRSGFTMGYKKTTTASVSTSVFDFGLSQTFAHEVTHVKSFGVAKHTTVAHKTVDKTDVSVQVPPNTEVTINYMRTIQHFEYQWKAVLELTGKYSLSWTDGQKKTDYVEQGALSKEDRKIYAFGRWSYLGTDTISVTITDKNGKTKASGCAHKPGETKSCNLDG